jgi:threonine dehydrogenase-like Zn-dependent dehydrogenase
VVVEVGACGLCGTDLHLIDSALQIVPWTMPSSSCPIAQTVMHRPLDRGAACRPLATR